mgnify:CR=1 FL=1
MGRTKRGGMRHRAPTQNTTRRIRDAASTPTRRQKQQQLLQVPYTAQEDQLFVDGKLVGQSWAAIAAQLNGRI